MANLVFIYVFSSIFPFFILVALKHWSNLEDKETLIVSSRSVQPMICSICSTIRIRHLTKVYIHWMLSWLRFGFQNCLQCKNVSRIIVIADFISSDKKGLPRLKLSSTSVLKVIITIFFTNRYQLFIVIITPIYLILPGVIEDWYFLGNISMTLHQLKWKMENNNHN